MLLVLTLQIALPVALLLCLAATPAKSTTGYFLQVLSTGLLLFALYKAALWVMLPWWLPYVYFLLLLCIILAHTFSNTKAFRSCLPTTFSGWIGFALVSMLGSLSTIILVQAVQARKPPNVEIIDIPLPFSEGTFLVAHGGSREIINGHMKTLDPSIERFRAFRGQSYAIDMIKINALGIRAAGLQPQDPAAYEIYGEPVFAPCAGVVISYRNNRPDMPVPKMDLDVFEGNHVLLACDNVELLLAHFEPESVVVKTGDRVNMGDPLARVGNSGRTTEPHLHISAQRPGTEKQPFSGEPLALSIHGRYLVRNDRIHASNGSE